MGSTAALKVLSVFQIMTRNQKAPTEGDTLRASLSLLLVLTLIISSFVSSTSSSIIYDRQTLLDIR